MYKCLFLINFNVYFIKYAFSEIANQIFCNVLSWIIYDEVHLCLGPKKKTQYKTVEGQHEFHFRFGWVIWDVFFSFVFIV